MPETKGAVPEEFLRGIFRVTYLLYPNKKRTWLFEADTVDEALAAARREIPKTLMPEIQWLILKIEDLGRLRIRA